MIINQKIDSSLNPVNKTPSTMQTKKPYLSRTYLYKTLVLSASQLVLAGCSNTMPAKLADRAETRPAYEKVAGNYLLNTSHTAQGQDERIRFVILHYTALNQPDSLAMLTGPLVSTHYLVPEFPQWRSGMPVIMQLVPESKRAWHAGVSSWGGWRALNASSVGVEMVNRGYTELPTGWRQWYPYTPEQIKAVSILLKDVIARNQIQPYNVLGHSDVAPLRKSDPGPLFPWEQLAAMGLGAWPDPQVVEKYLAGRAPQQAAVVLEVQQSLKRYGYDQIPQTGELDEDTRKTISAFQMHFRQADIGGNADAQTEAIAKALVEKYRQ